MCHQSVGLIQAAIESEGISTVSVSMLSEITQKVQPPRVLQVPFALGYPLGEPHKRELQEKIVKQALLLLETPQPKSGPLIQDFSFDK